MLYEVITIDPETLIIDSKSGTSGAGRAANVGTVITSYSIHYTKLYEG